MKEAKKGTCKKCKLYFYIHDHHVLLKNKFEKKGETVKLCPNCHTHFHEYSIVKNKQLIPMTLKKLEVFGTIG